MKQKMYKLLAVILCFAATQVCHAEKIFDEIAKLPKVESVYLGKAILSMTAGSSLKHLNIGKQIGMKRNALDGINSIEIINCENATKAQIRQAKQLAQKAISKKKLQVLLEQNKSDESMTIYGRIIQKDDAEVIQDLIIESDEANEYQLIYISGTINAESMKIELNR